MNLVQGVRARFWPAARGRFKQLPVPLRRSEARRLRKGKWQSREGKLLAEAEAFELEGNLEAARSMYQRVVNAPSFRMREAGHIRLALLEESEGREDAAFEHYRVASELSEWRLAEAYDGMAQILRRRGDTPEAERLFRKAVAAARHNLATDDAYLESPVRGLVDLLHSASRQHEALVFLEDLANGHPDRPEIRVMLEALKHEVTTSQQT